MKAGDSGLGGSQQKASLVIVSDASASFDDAKGNHFSSIVSRTSRAMEIVMARLAQRDIRLFDQEMSHEEKADSPIIHLPIWSVPPSFELEPGSRFQTQSASIQHGIKFVRTDLDRFAPRLIRYLIRHGYDVAASGIRGLGSSSGIDALKRGADLGADAVVDDEEHLERFMESQKSRFRKDNLYGMLSLPYSAICLVVLMFCTVWVSCRIFRL